MRYHMFFKWLLMLCISLACLVAQANTPGWRHLTPSMRYRMLDVGKPLATSAIHAFKFNLKDYQMRLSLASQYGSNTMPIEQFAKFTHALLAINGGFFTPGAAPLGLRIDQKKILNKIKDISWWGVFFIQNGKPHIASKRGFKQHKGIHFAIQAGPRLLVNGYIPKLKPGDDNRSAICITDKGEIVIVITQYLPLTTTTFAKILRKPAKLGGFGCRDALNLDGGSSSQLYAHIDDFYLHIPNISWVSDAIVVMENK